MTGGPKRPALVAADIATLVASLARQECVRRTPLALDFPQPTAFADATWESCGLDAASVATVAAQANAMCAGTVPAPHTAEPCSAFCTALWEQWQRGPRQLTFFTSGSTGQPKACIHSEAMLLQEARALMQHFASGAVWREALVAVPLHHVYGFMFGWLVPRLLQLRVTLFLALPTMVQARLTGGTTGLWFVGVPLLWQRLLALRHTEKTVTEHVFFSAGAPLGDAALAELAARGLHCVEVYGSTETGAVAFRTGAHEPFALLPHWRQEEGGRGEPGLARHLPDGNWQPVPAMDMLQWVDTRHMRPTGRLDKAVQIVGHNVYPERIATVLKKVPGVRGCVVRPMRPEEGCRLKAFVVPDESGRDMQSLRRALQGHARAQLKDAERPGSYAFGTQLPRNAMGKITDW